MSAGAEIWTVNTHCKDLLHYVEKFIQWIKIYKGLNTTHCFEYNRIIENRYFRGEDYIFSLEAIFF